MKFFVTFAIFSALAFHNLRDAEQLPLLLPRRLSREALVEEPPVVTKHQIHANGKTLSYTATTGMMPLRTRRARSRRIFSTSRTCWMEPPIIPSALARRLQRGPGSASVWLHMGCIGPKRVRMMDDGALPAAPYQLVDNENTGLTRPTLFLSIPSAQVTAARRIRRCNTSSTASKATSNRSANLFASF